MELPIKFVYLQEHFSVYFLFDLANLPDFHVGILFMRFEAIALRTTNRIRQDTWAASPSSWV